MLKGFATVSAVGLDVVPLFRGVLIGVGVVVTYFT